MFHIPCKAVLPYCIRFSAIAVLFISAVPHKRKQHRGGSSPIFFVRIPHVLFAVGFSLYGFSSAPKESISTRNVSFSKTYLIQSFSLSSKYRSRQLRNSSYSSFNCSKSTKFSKTRSRYVSLVTVLRSQSRLTSYLPSKYQSNLFDFGSPSVFSSFC